MTSHQSLAGLDDAAPAVEVEDLRVVLNSGQEPVTLVDGLSYSVRPGHAVALVGESGAGKSISCRAVLGLIDNHRFTVSGKISLGGVDLSSLRRKDRRHHIAQSAALVFQDPTRSLNPTMRVGCQIAEAMYKSHHAVMKKTEANDRALELMRSVGIADPAARFHSYPHELSGGMRQRIVIAIALSCQPKVIFADEPTTSLDVTMQAQIMDLLDELRDRLNVAVVLITHDLSLACSRADETMVMYAGRLVEKGPAFEIANRARMPYSRALIGAIPGMEVDGAMPSPIPGSPPDPRNLPTGCAFHVRCDRAKSVCTLEDPSLSILSPGHLCACFFPHSDDTSPLQIGQPS